MGPGLSNLIKMAKPNKTGEDKTTRKAAVIRSKNLLPACLRPISALEYSKMGMRPMLYFENSPAAIVSGDELVENLRSAVRSHVWMPERVVSQPRYRVIKHALGVIFEEGISKAFRRFSNKT